MLQLSHVNVLDSAATVSNNKLSIIYPASYDMVVNYKATFTCVSEIPPSWTFEGGRLPNNTWLFVRYNHAFLFIKPVELKNYGQYECHGIKRYSLSQNFIGMGNINVFGNDMKVYDKLLYTMPSTFT